MSWEQEFESWAQPPGKTEQDRCDNAASQIENAIDGSSVLTGYNIRVFAQGSYRNRTNVRQDSDVDICVLCTDIYNVDYSFSDGLTDKDVGLSDVSYTHAQFKDDVYQALTDYFGAANVVRGNKAFDIHENSYRVDADVVACFVHRRYTGKPGGTIRYTSGTVLRTDSGDRIINWPDQNYDNGVAKNTATDRRFKSCVRILKKLRNEMDDEGVIAAKQVASFLLESLIWNVPNSSFGHSTYTGDLRSVLAYLFNNTMKDELCHEWGEINELKYVFRSSQSWTREQAFKFLGAAWDFVGFE